MCFFFNVKYGKTRDVFLKPIHRWFLTISGDMMDYHGLSNMWPRELFSRALCVGEEQILEVIKLQAEQNVKSQEMDYFFTKRTWVLRIVMQQLLFLGGLRDGSPKGQ